MIYMLKGSEFLEENFPIFLQSKTKVDFLIKEHLKSPYRDPLVKI